MVYVQLPDFAAAPIFLTCQLIHPLLMIRMFLKPCDPFRIIAKAPRVNIGEKHVHRAQ